MAGTSRQWEGPLGPETSPQLGLKGQPCGWGWLQCEGFSLCRPDCTNDARTLFSTYTRTMAPQTSTKVHMDLEGWLHD